MLFDFKFRNPGEDVLKVKLIKKWENFPFFLRSLDTKHIKRRSAVYMKNWERGFLCSGDGVKHLTVFGNKLIA